MGTQRILCVDPDEGARQATVDELGADLTDLDVVFETAGSLAEARDAIDDDLGAVVTELDLPDGTGLELVGAVREGAPDAGCILYTDADPDAIDTDELRGALTEYVGKGSEFGAQRLAELVRTTVEERTQASYPLPQAEAERVAALRSYDLDDEALLSSLERVTDLAAAHFDVDTASINIIGEHSQEFLACHGEAEEWEPTEREDSICTFTILEDDLMAVGDVTADPRFESRSEQLVAMGIRSYLGANLVTGTDLVIGTLCVYDDEPRSFSAAEKSYLRKLASVAMDVIEARSDPDVTVAADGGRR